MNDTSGMHWTTDDELLEQFVMERLNPAQREELIEHLRACDACRKTVEKETLLVAGIKHAGREEMKLRLKRTIGSASPQIPWIRISSIAAIVVVLIGVGIFNEWFTFQHQEPALVSSRQQETPILEPRRTDELEGTKEDQESKRERTMKDKPAPYAQAKKQGSGNQLPVPSAGKEQQDVGREQAANELAEERTQDLVLAEPAAGATESTSQLWVSGTIVPAPAAAGGEATMKSFANNESRRDYRSSRKTATDSMEERRVEVITLSQQPASELPRAQQMIQQPSRMQALVEQTRGGVHVTLFPSSPLSEDQMKNAIARRVGPDSLLVILGNEMVGYKLPAGLRNAEQR